MTALVFITLASFIVAIIYRPYLSLLFAMIIMGLAPVFDLFLGSNVMRFGFLALIFLVQLIKAGNKKRYSVFYFFAAIVFIKEVIGVAVGSSPNSFLQAVYSYVILVGISFFSYWDLKNNNIDFLDLFKLYIIICLGILFYRTLFDYSFFGLALEQDLMARYADAYEYGSYSFRPSSLESSIVFSIQLSIFLSWMLFKEGINKKNFILYLLAIIGLLLTFSRSGLLLLFIAIAVYSIRSHITPGKILFLVVCLILLMQAFDYTDRFLDIFNRQSETAGYEGRFNSMRNVLQQIKDFDFINIILGLGYGVANTVGKDGTVRFYVENYYLTLLINSGFLALVFFVLYYLGVILRGVKKFIYHSFLCSLILLVNFIACSLYANSVFVLLFYLSLCVIYGDTVAIETKHAKKS